MSLSIPLSRNEPLGRQVVAGLRSAIVSGTLRAGERLPSTRALAEQLRVSRTVVLVAYEQLMAEGFAVGRPGSGTYVATGLGERAGERGGASIPLSAYGSRAAGMSGQVRFPERRGPHFRYDFAYGRGDVTQFPFERWRRLLLKHARLTSARGLDYGDAAGDRGLREAIAAHVRRSRGVVCEPSQVIVVSGSQQAIDLVVRVLVDPGDPIAIEDPHYQGTRATLQAGGAVLKPVRVDGSGLDPAALPDVARAVFVTPSHQFPTGAVLPLKRRLELLDWASRAGAVVVEDDYDGEFRHDGPTLESLQGLDASGRVIYVGTFSRTIFAALRIGYLVVPAPLIDAFATAKWLTDRHTATLEQRVLAEFIASGSYEVWLRRLRRGLAVRREALLAAVEEAWKGGMQLTGAAAGAHVVLRLPPGSDEAAAVRAAAERDVGVYGVAGYHLGRPEPGLLLGYSQLSPRDIGEGVARLAGALPIPR